MGILSPMLGERRRCTVRGEWADRRCRFASWAECRIARPVELPRFGGDAAVVVAVVFTVVFDVPAVVVVSAVTLSLFALEEPPSPSSSSTS